MTTRLTLILAVLVIALLVLDATLDLGAGLFLAKKGLELISYMAFWR